MGHYFHQNTTKSLINMLRVDCLTPAKECKQLFFLLLPLTQSHFNYANEQKAKRVKFLHIHFFFPVRLLQSFVCQFISFESSFICYGFCIWILAFFRVHAMFLATLNQHFIWHYLTMRMLSLPFFPIHFLMESTKKTTKKNARSN